MAHYSNVVMDWLSANSEWFGVPAQNWMLVVGAGLLIYIAVLVVSETRQTRAR
jgi:hypothetical protein